MRDEASDTMEGGMSDVNEWFSRNMLSVPMLRPVLPPPRSEADFSECYVGRVKCLHRIQFLLFQRSADLKNSGTIENDFVSVIV